MITKTITTHEYTILAVNLELAEIERLKIVSDRAFRSERSAESEFYKSFAADKYKFVKVDGVQRTSRQYSLSTEAFVAAALLEENQK